MSTIDSVVAISFSAPAINWTVMVMAEYPRRSIRQAMGVGVVSVLMRYQYCAPHCQLLLKQHHIVIGTGSVLYSQKGARAPHIGSQIHR
jgi:hypothetical protein